MQVTIPEIPIESQLAVAGLTVGGSDALKIRDVGEPEDQPHRGRGRPRNERRQPTPDPRAFEDIVAAIQALPRKARPAAKEHAIALVDADPEISAGGGKVYRALQQRLKWFSGIIFVMSEKLAAELGVSLSTVERGLRALQRRGYIKRKRLEGTARGDGYDLWQTTVPAVVPLAQNHPSKKSHEPPVKKIKTTRQKCGAEPLSDDEEERESARARALLFEKSRAAAPWSFPLPTEAQVAEFARAAATWYGRPLDLDGARQGSQQLLAAHLRHEELADVDQALSATIAILHGVQSRRGNLASYASKALADELSKVKQRRAQDEADHRVIAAKAEAKIATEKAIGVKREQAMDAAVAANAADKQKRQAPPAGRYTVDANGRRAFNEFAVVRFGFTEIPGANLAQLQGIFCSLTPHDVEQELANLESSLPVDKKGRREQLTVNEILARIYRNLDRTNCHRIWGEPWKRCAGPPHDGFVGPWVAISKQTVERVGAETGLSEDELLAIFGNLRQMMEKEEGEPSFGLQYRSADFPALWEAKFVELVKAEQEERAKQEARERAAQRERAEKAEAERQALEAITPEIRDAAGGALRRLGAAGVQISNPAHLRSNAGLAQLAKVLKDRHHLFLRAVELAATRARCKRTAFYSWHTLEEYLDRAERIEQAEARHQAEVAATPNPTATADAEVFWEGSQ